VTGPTGAAGSGAIVKTNFGEVAADTSTTSTAFVDLISLPIVTTVGGVLLVWASFAGSPVAAAVSGLFRVTLDGVPIRAGGIFMNNNNPQDGAIVLRIPGVGLGAHTVALQWRTSTALLGIQIRPVAAPNSEHGSLLVAESSA
jgi:hypothetical protein